MEIEVFNTKGFKAGDFVKVIMNNGSEEVIQLERGEIYMGSPAKKHYTTGEIIPATPPCIVVQGTLDVPEGRGITIADVKDVVRI
jgi:hypothetical protein